MNSRTKIVIYSIMGLTLAVSAAAQRHQVRPLVPIGPTPDYINTVVGGGPNNMPAVDANVYQAYYIAFDAQGNYYYASYGQHRVFKVDTTGQVTLIAGNGFAGYSGDGGPAISAELDYPQGIAVDNANPANVYLADSNNCVIREISQSTGIIHTIAGGTDNLGNGCGYGGDAGPASAANLYYPTGLAVNPVNGDLYVADTYNARIRKVAGGVASGSITTVAGGNVNGNCGGSAPYGDGGTATSATLCYPGAVTLDTSVSPPNVFISNDTLSNNTACAIREVVGSSGKIYRIAGSYSLGCGYADTAVATNGQISSPYQLQAQVSGGTTTVWFADYGNARVRKFTLTYSAGVPQAGPLTSFAGGTTTVSCSGFGDGGPASSACLDPVGLALDSGGNPFISDWSYNRIRKISAVSPNNVNTAVGWGDASTGYSQPFYSNPVNNNNVPGLGVSLYGPFGLLADSVGNLLIAGDSDQTVRQLIATSGNVNTFAGNGVAGFAGDGNAASDSATQLNYPTGIAKDNNGNTFIADVFNCVVRVVHTDGTIHSFAGGTDGIQNGCGYSGDNGPATAAQLSDPYGVAVDGANNVYIADYANQVIRKVDSSGLITTVAGNGTNGYSGDGGPATSATMRYPTGVAVDAAGNLYIADSSSHRIREVNAATHIITTVAGNGAAGFSGDGIATQNSLYYPAGISADANGNMFIADSNNNILRWVDPAGTMLTFAGVTQVGAGFAGDGGPALSALMALPQSISQDGAGNFYAADQNNNRIREVYAFAGVGRSTSSLNYGITPVNTTNLNPGLVTLSAIGPTNISNIATSGDFNESDNCIGGLTAGQTCTVNVYFAPTGSGARYGTLSITSNGNLASLETVALQGEGTAVSVKGSPIAFGSSIISQSVSKSVTLTNSGSTAMTINSTSLTQTTDFALGTAATLPCPASGTLNGKASCNILVTFTPHTIGVKKGTLVVKTSDPASPLLISMSGTGSSYEVFTPASVSVAATQLNVSSKATKVTFKYTGTGTLTLNGLTSNNAAFTLNTTGLTGACNLSGPTSLATGASCPFNVVFKPTAAGTTSSTVTASYSGDPAGTTSLNLPVSGIGTEVKLSATTLGFGTVANPSTKQLSVSVTNIGTVGLTFGTPSISGAGASAYSVVPYNGTASTCLQSGLVMAQNGTCKITVQFTPPPGSGVSFPASLSIVDNDAASPQAVKITGIN